MMLRLHGGGRFATWLGTRLGGDAQLGERAWRRILHGCGVFVLLYLVLPSNFFVVLSTTEVLLLLLASVILLEVLRQLGRVELGLIRPYEQHRVGSFVQYAAALAFAVLVFPPPIAVVVVLGVAIVDPVIGEIRLRDHPGRFTPQLPILIYTGLGVLGLTVGFAWPVLPALGLSFVLGVIGVFVERARLPWVDDDVLMTIVPGVVGTVLVLAVPMVLGAAA